MGGPSQSFEAGVAALLVDSMMLWRLVRACFEGRCSQSV